MTEAIGGNVKHLRSIRWINALFVKL